VASGVLAGGYFVAFGGAKDLADKAKAMELLGDLPFAAIVPIALFAGFYEEVVFRGFLLDRLRIVFGQSRRGLVLAVLVSSALFAAGHAYQGALGIIQTFAAGACFAALAAIRRSLWSSIVAHAVIDLFGLFALHYLRPFLEKALEQQGIHGIP
jgi:membrane protease YdiL (CAAX protease family)